MINFDVIIQNSLKGLDDPLKDSIFTLAKENLGKAEDSINELVEAYEKEEITKDELATELEREKEIFEAELISCQVISRDEISKISDNIFKQIEQSL